MLFLFTPPARVATDGIRAVISIHATHAGSDDSTVVKHLRLCISIHATRVGSDLDVCEFLAGELISIHAARVGGDFPGNAGQTYFYSRYPNGQRREHPAGTDYFYSRHPHGRRQMLKEICFCSH